MDEKERGSSIETRLEEDQGVVDAQEHIADQVVHTTVDNEYVSSANPVLGNLDNSKKDDGESSRPYASIMRSERFESQHDTLKIHQSKPDALENNTRTQVTDRSTSDRVSNPLAIGNKIEAVAKDTPVVDHKKECMEGGNLSLGIQNRANVVTEKSGSIANSNTSHKPNHDATKIADNTKPIPMSTTNGENKVLVDLTEEDDDDDNIARDDEVLKTGTTSMISESMVNDVPSSNYQSAKRRLPDSFENETEAKKQKFSSPVVPPSENKNIIDLTESPTNSPKSSSTNHQTNVNNEETQPVAIHESSKIVLPESLLPNTLPTKEIEERRGIPLSQIEREITVIINMKIAPPLKFQRHVKEYVVLHRKYRKNPNHLFFNNNFLMFHIILSWFESGGKFMVCQEKDELEESRYLECPLNKHLMMFMHQYFQLVDSQCPNDISSISGQKIDKGLVVRLVEYGDICDEFIYHSFPFILAHKNFTPTKEDLFRSGHEKLFEQTRLKFLNACNCLNNWRSESIGGHVVDYNEIEMSWHEAVCFVDFLLTKYHSHWLNHYLVF